jgi:hypothetical protein
VCEGNLRPGVIRRINNSYLVVKVTADDLVFDIEPSCGPRLFDRRQDAADWIRRDILKRLDHAKLRRYGIQVDE